MVPSLKSLFRTPIWVTCLFLARTMTIDSLLCNRCSFPFPPCLPSWEMLYSWSFYALQRCFVLGLLFMANSAVLLWEAIWIFLGRYFCKWQRARGKGGRKKHMHSFVGVLHGGQTFECYCLQSGDLLGIPHASLSIMTSHPCRGSSP